MVSPSYRVPGSPSLIHLLLTPLHTLYSSHTGFGMQLALERTKFMFTSGPSQVPCLWSTTP